MQSIRRRLRDGNSARAGVILAVAAVLSGCYYRGCACDDRGRRYGDHDRGHDRDRHYDHDRR